MINFNFLDEWLLLKSNVKNLFLNQRLTRFPYLIGVLFLLLEVYIGNLIIFLGIVDSLKHWGIKVTIKEEPSIAIPAFTGSYREEHLQSNELGGKE